MNVKKFVAPTARDALNKIKEILGSDAIILSNRQINGGVEIMAVAASDLSQIANAPLNDASQNASQKKKRKQSPATWRLSNDDKSTLDESEKTSEEPPISSTLSATRTESVATEDHLARGRLTKALVQLLTDREDQQPFAVGLFGHWGDGKSSQVQLLRDALAQSNTNPRVLVAKFNAWKNEKASNLGAVMAQTVVDKLLVDKGFFERIWLAVRLAARRKEQLRNSLGIESERFLHFLHRWWGALFPLITVITAITLGWILVPVELLGKTENLLTGSFLTVSALYVTCFHYLRSNLTEWFKRISLEKPLSIFSLPDYSSHHGLIGDIHRTLHHLSTLCLKGSPPDQGTHLLLVVDDLDRCSISTIKEAFDAIRLVADIPRIVTLVAIDERAAFAAIEKHFDQFSIPGRTPAQVARDYLGKILQISVRLPPIGKEEINFFVANVLFSNADSATPVATSSPVATVATEGAPGPNDLSPRKHFKAEETLFRKLANAYSFSNPRLLWRLHIAWKILKSVSLKETYTMRDATPLMRFLFWREWLFQQNAEIRTLYSEWLLGSHEVLPINSASGNLVKSVFDRENGLEEAVFRRTDHRFFETGGSWRTDQGAVSATRVQ